MGLLVDGEWQAVWYDTKSNGGAFKRSEAQFRNWLTADGSPGPAISIGTYGFLLKRTTGSRLPRPMPILSTATLSRMWSSSASARAHYECYLASVDEITR